MKWKQVIEQMNRLFRSFKNEFTILMNIFVQRNKVQSWASDDQLHKQANIRKLLQKGEVQVTKPSTHPLSGYVLPLGAYPNDVGNIRHRQKLPRAYFHHFWYYHVYLRKFIIRFSWLCEGLSEHSMLAELLLFWPFYWSPKIIIHQELPTVSLPKGWGNEQSFLQFVHARGPEKNTVDNSLLKYLWSITVLSWRPRKLYTELGGIFLRSTIALCAMLLPGSDAHMLWNSSCCTKPHCCPWALLSTGIVFNRIKGTPKTHYLY